MTSYDRYYGIKNMYVLATTASAITAGMYFWNIHFDTC
jgi:hypothetical protein